MYNLAFQNYWNLIKVNYRYNNKTLWLLNLKTYITKNKEANNPANKFKVSSNSTMKTGLKFSLKLITKKKHQERYHLTLF